MKTLRYGAKGDEVLLLKKALMEKKYLLNLTRFFDEQTKETVITFQKNNDLVPDGIVGPKTWGKLGESKEVKISITNKKITEKDIIDFATKYDLEKAVVKAVAKIESNGKGFLKDGRPRILFEGHVFWRELERKKIDPSNFISEETKNVLYQKWTKKYYKGGIGEYLRVEKAAGISEDSRVHEAAYNSASWGGFQILGYHYKKLGYESIDQFVAKMYEHEREHLKAFGLFINNKQHKGQSLIGWLREKNWAKFAEGYNGSAYKKNRYDEKLEEAYQKYI